MNSVPMDIFILFASHLIPSVFSLVANFVLIYLICVSTPRHMRPIAVHIVNMAANDIIQALAGAFTIPRLISSSIGGLDAFYGPCVYFGPAVCHCFIMVYGECFVNNLFHLLIFFLVRNYIIAYGDLTTTNTWMACSTLMSMVRSAQEDVEAELVRTGFRIADPTAVVAGYHDIFIPKVFVAIVLYCAVPAPIIAVLWVLRRILLKQIAENTLKLNKEAISLHRHIVTVITIQSLTPLLFAITGSLFFLNQQIFQSYWLQATMYIPAGFAATMTPVVNIALIRPYRNRLLRIFKQNKKPNIISQIHE